MRYLIWIFCFLGTGSVFAETKVLKLWDRSFKWNENITKEVLKITEDEYGPVKLEASVPLEQGRASKETALDRYVNIIIFPTTEEREKELLPIRIPLKGGLMGWRVCLIHKDNQNKFANISSLADFTKAGLTIGQGTHWPDTAILKHNGIPVIHTVKYQQVKQMLVHKRYDCFSRALIEVAGEITELEPKGVILEKDLLLHYPMPQFFFVSRKNPKLAERIEKGLRKLIAQNRLGELSSFEMSKVKHFAKNRRLIKLSNPNITKETEATFADKAIWLDPRF